MIESVLRAPIAALAWVASSLWSFGCSAETPRASAPDPIVTSLAPQDHITQLSDVPGSYEWWNFYAEDASGDCSLSAIFMSANLFDVNYRRAVRAWQASPQQEPPPRPEDAWLLQLNLTIDGEKFFTNVRQWPETTVEFARDRPAGRIGDSTFEVIEEEGKPVFRILLDAPDATNSYRLQGELELREGAPGFTVKRGMYDGIEGGNRHAWQLPLGLPMAKGSFRELRRDGSTSLPERGIEGRGYVDHMWGEGLLGDVLSSWHFGTADLGEESKLVYVWLVPIDQGLPHGFLFFISAGQMPVTRRIENLVSLEQRQGGMGLAFDAHYLLELDDGGQVRVAFEDKLGEDWPFQVSGATTVDVAIPGVVETKGVRAVGEYLLQSGIDSDTYAALFEFMDQMEWNP
jgi:hypothetical protein